MKALGQRRVHIQYGKRPSGKIFCTTTKINGYAKKRTRWCKRGKTTTKGRIRALVLWPLCGITGEAETKATGGKQQSTNPCLKAQVRERKTAGQEQLLCHKEQAHTLHQKKGNKTPNTPPKRSSATLGYSMTVSYQGLSSWRVVGLAGKQAIKMRSMLSGEWGWGREKTKRKLLNRIE